MAVIVGDGRLTLTGYVGEASLIFDGCTVFDGFTHAEVLTALGEFDDDSDLVVHINSGGGYATEGAAIRSALSERAGRTDILVEGIAASAASLIAMAGETVTMANDAVMMIHSPSGLTLGTIADHEATIRALNSLGGAYARSYARKSGKTVSECLEIMAAEAWFDAGEAVAAGFANEIEGEAAAVAAFPYQTYAHAPRELVALAKENGWRAPVIPSAALAAKPAAPSAAPTGQKQETEMTDKTKADDTTAKIEAARKEAATDAVKADRERRSAIMALDEASGRESLAAFYANETDDDIERVKKALAASPKAAEPAPEPAPDPKAGYDAGRTTTANGAGLGAGAGSAPKQKSAALSEAVDRTNKRRAAR